jgi:hypothetical protein
MATSSVLPGSKSAKTKTTDDNFFENILKRMAGKKLDEKLTDDDRTELYTCAGKNAVAFLLLLVSAITIGVASYNRESYSKYYIQYMLVIILPIIISAGLIFPIFSQKLSTPIIILNATIFIVMVLAIYVFFQIKNPGSLLIVKYSIYVVGFLSLIISLAILYNILVRYIYNKRGWEAIIIQIIFFIPCLLIDFIEYIKNELKITSKTTYILLAIEAFLLAFYFAILPLMRPKPSTSGTVLLNDPVFLNQDTPVGYDKVFLLQKKDKESSADPIQNFGISFWAFMNNNSKSVCLFRIGNINDPIGKLNIICEIDGTYTSTLTSTTITSTTTKTTTTKKFILNKNDDSSISDTDIKPVLPTQKWNHIAISIEPSTINVFLNGKLNNAYKREGFVFVFDKSDIVILGSNIPSSNVGAICNVRYYDKPEIMNNDVESNYNAFKNKNPPIPDKKSWLF